MFVIAFVSGWDTNSGSGFDVPGGILQLRFVTSVVIALIIPFESFGFAFVISFVVLIVMVLVIPFDPFVIALVIALAFPLLSTVLSL